MRGRRQRDRVSKAGEGDEVGYFQFRDSDVVVLVEPCCKYEDTASEWDAYQMDKKLRVS